MTTPLRRCLHGRTEKQACAKCQEMDEIMDEIEKLRIRLLELET